jgi:transposase-like protein
VATGITPEGERQVLGVSVSLSEHETHWKAFLKGLKDRGMNGVKLVISDDHTGLGAARRAVLGSVNWQTKPVGVIYLVFHEAGASDKIGTFLAVFDSNMIYLLLLI